MPPNKTLIEVATDVKWIKENQEKFCQSNTKDHTEIIQRLYIMNGQGQRSKTNIKNMWLILGGYGTVLLAIIAYLALT